MRRHHAATTLAERLCRPHRIGLFGHRGVGKTTLLTMLYREAVAGRLPDLRLAAADAATAEYLGDKVTQFEGGQTLPATLAETDLQFHLYHGQNRFELVLRDYQGEHVELGRDGSIQEFLRDCDAVWLCIDLAALPEAAARLRRQQEIEQLIEDYLKCEPRPTVERPIALLLTKADVLPQVPDDLDALTEAHFGMTRHALQSHCSQNGIFAVSSRAALTNQGSAGLGQPLVWLAEALRALDHSRLERLWTQSSRNIAMLDRCVANFARRYPDTQTTAGYQQRLRDLRLRRRRNWSLATAATAACLALAVWSYDAIGLQQAERFAVDHTDTPAAVQENWQRFEAWHPTRHLSQTVTTLADEQRQADLARQVRDKERDGQLATLRRQATDLDADPSQVWQRFQDFRVAFPEVNIDADLQQLRSAIKARHDEQVNQRARRALDELKRAAQRSDDLPALVKLADTFLAEYPGSALEEEARRCRTTFVHRLDEQDIQAARAYSARNPLNFQTRREHYQRYLDKHPAGGAFTKEADEALRLIAVDWDKHDFRAVRDHFVKDPGKVNGLAAHCRRYLNVHPQGKFKASATELLRWTERVSVPGEYKVVLHNGEFDKNVSRWFSRGPKLSVELEVNGIRYGPSTISYNRYDPEWDFEFPRRVRWKLGDSVVIRVTDHNWSNKVVMEVASEADDPLALRMLNGDVNSGAYRLTFKSEFAMPVLPKIE
jgi:hypothetical protein